MKYFLTNILLLLSTLFISCNKEETNQTPDTPEEPKCELVFAQGQELEYSLPVDPAQFDVSFTSTHYWSATFDGEKNWIRLYPSYGVAGDGKFTVMIDENETLEGRDAKITIAYGDTSKEISIHQAGRTRLKLTFKGSELIGPFTEAYKYYIANDLMPETIEICGETLKRGPYFELMHRLLIEIRKGGDGWKNQVYDNLKCIETSIDNSTKYDTYAPESIALSDVVSINERQINYAKGHGNVLANYCSVDNTTFSLTRSIVVTARVLYSYFTDGVLPESVNSWPSDYLRDINYHTDAIPEKGCSLSDPAVITARDKAIQGKESTMDKAVAIFDFTRDEWEWEDYNNTNKGAVKVIECKTGNCCDLTHGLVAIARAAGIPARYVHGPRTYYPSGNTWGHVWGELYVDGEWYICDPSNNSCKFGKPNWIIEKTELNGKYKDLLF